LCSAVPTTLSTWNIIVGKGDPSRQWKWQVVFTGEVIQVDVKDAEAMKAVDSEE
jgi:hypothetical protein